MGWKPEYEENRRRKHGNDPEWRARQKQYARTPEENKAYMRKYYLANRPKFRRTREQQEKVNQRRREKYATDSAYRDEQKRLVKAYWQSNPRARKQQRIRKYGLTLKEYDALLAAQGGKCAICRRSDFPGPTHFPFIDHCHSTGRVRGILCANCNHGLGKFKDDPDILIEAYEYIVTSRAMDRMVQLGLRTESAGELFREPGLFDLWKPEGSRKGESSSEMAEG